MDVIHVSDLHFSGWNRRAETDRWRVLCEHVKDCRSREGYQPALIACTGDLVDTPWPLGGAAYRRSVNALFDLAEAAGLLDPGAPRWLPAMKAPPKGWWELLGRRLLVVPGNHDFFPSGLRAMWTLSRSGFQSIVEHPESGEQSFAQNAWPGAVRIATVNGHPFLSIDSNGGRSLWKAARGVVERQMALRWPEESADSGPIKICLIHAHPVQVPFELDGGNAESLMTLENAGLLLRNLSRLGIRVVLHGHRHYPHFCSVSVANGGGELHSMAIVGAGSATRPPGGWPFCSYNWIRIHRDNRVEVRSTKLAAGANKYEWVESNHALVLPGSYTSDRVVAELRYMNDAGDAEVETTIHGLRVHRGREPISYIPLAPIWPKVAAHQVVVQNGPKGLAAKWDANSGRLNLEPALGWESVPLSVSVRYYCHGLLAADEWEGAELGLSNLSQGFGLQIGGETRHLQLRASLPTTFSLLTTQGNGGLRAQVSFVGGDRGAALSREYSNYVRAVPVQNGVQVELDIPQPELGATIAIEWQLGRRAINQQMERSLSYLRAWQRHLVSCHNQGVRELDDLAFELTRQLAQTEGLDVEVGLLVPDWAFLRACDSAMRGGSLLMVGEAVSPSDPRPLRLSFGSGVAGRALRLGGPVWYDSWLALERKKNYEDGRSAEASNFYEELQSDRRYSALLAVPVFPGALMAHEGYRGSDTTPFTLLVASLGQRDQPGQLAQLGSDEQAIMRVAKSVAQTIEARAYRDAVKLAKP